MNSCGPLRIIIGAGTDQTIDFIRYFSFPYDDNPTLHTLVRLPLAVSKSIAAKFYHRFYYFFGYKYSIKNEVGENIVTGLANRNLLLKNWIKMDFGETFPIKNSSFKEFTLFLFDINQRHGQNGKSGTICPLLSKSNWSPESNLNWSLLSSWKWPLQIERTDILVMFRFRISQRKKRRSNISVWIWLPKR